MDPSHSLILSFLTPTDHIISQNVVAYNQKYQRKRHSNMYVYVQPDLLYVFYKEISFLFEEQKR